MTTTPTPRTTTMTTTTASSGCHYYLTSVKARVIFCDDRRNAMNETHDLPRKQPTRPRLTDEQRRARRRALRRAREDVLRSLGLVKVRGALGGTYWE
jgi:hypothetical protein